MRGRYLPLLALLLSAMWPLSGCSNTPSAPIQPTWKDVAPILRGECDSCHGWTAKDTGSSYRLDFYEVTKDLCGEAALAMDAGVVLAGSSTVPARISQDIQVAQGSAWPRMPPLPSPGLADWQLETIERWATTPVKGPAPTGNRPPTITVTGMPLVVDSKLSFTAVLDDPDGDSVIGVIEAGGYAFLMNRPGSFAVNFDTTTWPASALRPTAVLCDGWTSTTSDLGPVQVEHFQ